MDWEKYPFEKLVFDAIDEALFKKEKYFEIREDFGMGVAKRI